MTARRTALLGLALAALAAPGCRRAGPASTGPDLPGPLFQRPEWGLTLHAPRGWTVAGGPDFGGAALLIGPVESGFATNITIVSVPAPNQSLDEFCQAQERDLSAASPGIEVVARESGRLGNVPAHLLRLKHRQDGDTLEALQCAAVQGGRGHVLTLSAAAGQLDRHVEEFEECLAGVLFTLPEEPAPSEAEGSPS